MQNAELFWTFIFVIAKAIRLVTPLRLSRGQRLLADFAEAEQ